MRIEDRHGGKTIIAIGYDALIKNALCVNALLIGSLETRFLTLFLPLFKRHSQFLSIIGLSIIKNSRE